MGDDQRVCVVRSHVGVRVGEARGRSGDASVRCLHPDRLRSRIAAALPARQPHDTLHAA